MTTATKKKAKPGKDSVRAEELMTRYALMNKSRQDLLDTIMDELKRYEQGMKETEKELIEIGERNRASFNTEGNWMMEDGYLHIAKTTVAQTGRNFDLAQFAQERPDMIDIKLKVKPIKEAFLDKDQRKELKALGVSVDTRESIEVKITKR